MPERTTIRRAATYARVSTRQQADDPRNTSLTEQQRRCREAAGEAGATVVAELVDAGESGASLDRPAMAELLELVDDGLVDIVVASKPDRVSRSLADLASLVSRLSAAGVDLLLIDSPVDVSTPHGRAMLQMQGVFGELERSLITARMADGITAAGKAGRWIGGRAPYGYKLDSREDGTWPVIDPAQAEVVHRLCAMLVDGASTGSVARALNAADIVTAKGLPWTSSNVRQLTRRNLGVWAGTFVFRKTSDKHDPIEIEVPPIITEATREAVAATLDSYSTRRETVRTYLLSGRIASPHGAIMHGHPHKGIRRYKCSHRFVSQRPPGADQCTCRTVHAKTVETAVWDRIIALLADPARLEALARDHESSAVSTQRAMADVVADLDDRIVAAEAELSDAYRQAIDGGMSPRAATAATLAYAERLDELIRRRDDAVTMRRAGLRAAASASAISKAAELARQGLAEAGDRLVQEILDAMDIRVTVTGWSTCTACGGSGVRGAQEGRGTRRCPGCQAMRALPDVTVSGVIPEALVLDGEGAEITPLHPPRAVPFTEAG